MLSGRRLSSLLRYHRSLDDPDRHTTIFLRDIVLCNILPRFLLRHRYLDFALTLLRAYPCTDAERIPWICSIKEKSQLRAMIFFLKSRSSAIAEAAIVFQLDDYIEIVLGYALLLDVCFPRGLRDNLVLLLVHLLCYFSDVQILRAQIKLFFEVSRLFSNPQSSFTTLKFAIDV